MSKKIKAVVLSSLSKVLPEQSPEGEEKTVFSCLKNEPLSFQVAYKYVGDGLPDRPFNLKITTDLPISLYSEGAVNVPEPLEANLTDIYRPGLIYDILYPKAAKPKIEIKGDAAWNHLYFDNERVQLAAARGSWKVLWFTVNEDEKTVAPGKHAIRIEMLSRRDGTVSGECELTVEVINARLPLQKLIYTRWLHCDCLCDIYNVEMFSERFWEIYRNFAAAAAKNGQNMILTPCFTPPLDTPVGHERRTAQLIGVEVIDGEYRFDFSLLKRFIDESRRAGFTYFEHSHLFTQCGAKAAPKIMATANGKYRRIFGWETKASGKKYARFLRAYLPELLAFLDAQGLKGKMLFHVSDEPREEMKKDYTKARNIVKDFLKDQMCGDALWNYRFYEDGTVTTPIVSVDNIQEFFGRCSNLWAYNTGAHCSDGMSNSKLNCSSERNRMLGIQLYAYKIKGFLHWGYNYYYDVLSQGVFDPKVETCFFDGGNPGTSYFVYPENDGSCLQSIRQKVFYEGLNDMRALLALEKLIGRRKTMDFLSLYYGKVDFHTAAGSADKLLGFREALNREIEIHTAERRKTC